MYKELKSPLVVQLELTTRCNHRCVHCYNHWRSESVKDKTLSVDEIERIINNLKEGEVSSLLITGGEPMLYPELMLTALDLGRKAGLQCAVNSNLTLVTPEIAKELKRLEVGVLTSMLSYDPVLHDSLTTSSGSFARLIKGIKILQEFGVPVSVNMVVMRANMDQIYETGKFVHSLGVSSFRATKVHPAQGSSIFEDIKLPPERIVTIFDNLLRLESDFGMKVDSLTTYPICLLKDLERYGRFLLKRSCSAGKAGCTIGADGQVRPCGHSDDSYGNASEESILTIWPRLGCWRDDSMLPTECKECKYIRECSGGCRMECKHYGKVDGMDPYATGNNFTAILPKSVKIKQLDFDVPLVVNPNLSFRTEKFGSALIVNREFKSIVTADSAKLLAGLLGTTFTLDFLLEQYTLDKEVLRSFFSRLYKQNVICSADKQLP